jgi:hypothetical protein
MTDELHGLPGDNGVDEEEVILPTPSTNPVETFTLSDEELDAEVDPSGHRKPTTAHHDSGWVTGPGMVDLLVEASRLLVKATELTGQLDEKLPWVHVTALRANRCLLVRPTTSADIKKRPVTWRKGQAHFVASDVLMDAGFPVETGYKKRYEVHLIQSSKKGPTVVIDMREPLATKVLPKPKGKSSKDS